MDIKQQEELPIRGSSEDVDHCNIFCSPLKPHLLSLFCGESQTGRTKRP